VRRYNWHSAGAVSWPFSNAKIKIHFSNKIHGSNVIRQHSKIVVV